MRKRCTALIVICCLWMVSQAMADTSSSKRLAKIGKTLFELQQDYLVLKEDYENQKKQWNAQQGIFDRLVRELTESNQSLQTKTNQLQLQVDVFEENLENAESVQVGKDIDELSRLLKAIILDSVQNQIQSEELILEIVNDAKTKIPRDLLVLYLGVRNEELGEWENSLGYYGTLITEFPDSPYIYRSILAMSDLFGKLEKPEEQSVLLHQLIYLDEENPYAIEAKERLAELESASSVAETADSSNVSLAGQVEVNPMVSTESPTSTIPEIATGAGDQTTDVLLKEEFTGDIEPMTPEPADPPTLESADPTTDIQSEAVIGESGDMGMPNLEDATTDHLDEEEPRDLETPMAEPESMAPEMPEVPINSVDSTGDAKSGLTSDGSGDAQQPTPISSEAVIVESGDIEASAPNDATADRLDKNEPTGPVETEKTEAEGATPDMPAVPVEDVGPSTDPMGGLKLGDSGDAVLDASNPKDDKAQQTDSSLDHPSVDDQDQIAESEPPMDPKQEPETGVENVQPPEDANAQ